jgi:hypothetical protein
MVDVNLEIEFPIGKNIARVKLPIVEISVE